MVTLALAVAPTPLLSSNAQGQGPGEESVFSNAAGVWLLYTAFVLHPPAPGPAPSRRHGPSGVRARGALSGRAARGGRTLLSPGTFPGVVLPARMLRSMQLRPECARGPGIAGREGPHHASAVPADHQRPCDRLQPVVEPRARRQLRRADGAVRAPRAQGPAPGPLRAALARPLRHPLPAGARRGAGARRPAMRRPRRAHVARARRRRASCARGPIAWRGSTGSSRWSTSSNSWARATSRSWRTWAAVRARKRSDGPALLVDAEDVERPGGEGSGVALRPPAAEHSDERPPPEDLRSEVASLRSEVAQLRHELEELRQSLGG